VTDPKEKRRLGLLPELLPAPAPAAEGGPRGRTLAHLQKLLVMASTTAVIEGCDGCGPGYGVVDPMPPPARCQPPFDGTVTAALAGGVVTVVLEAKNNSTLRAGTLSLSQGKIESSKLEGNKQTVTFRVEQGTSWYLEIPGTCNGLEVGVTVQIYLEGSGVAAQIAQAR